MIALGLLATVLVAGAGALTRNTSLVSLPTGLADPNTDDVTFLRASPDGTRVIFETNQKLTADDLDGPARDLYQRSSGTTTLLSKPTGVVDPNTEDTVFAGASTDATRVFFQTGQKMTADDLDASRVDVYERAGGVTTLLSKPTGVAEPDSDIFFAGASSDGTRVFLQALAPLTTDDADANFQDVYQRAGGMTTLLSKETGVLDPNNGHETFAGASQDGTRVFFQSFQKLTADDDDANREDVYQRTGGVTTLLSKETGVADPDSDKVEFEGASEDGTRVFMETTQKLTAEDDDADREDVYERAGTTTTLISQPTGVMDPDAGDASFGGSSRDGSRVFFGTAEKLTADDLDSDLEDVYQRAAGTTTLVTEPTGVDDPDTGGAGFEGASVDGTRVFFDTEQVMTTDDGDTREDVYERTGGITTLVSKPTGVADLGTEDVGFEAVSEDGTRVFLQTDAKLTADDLDAAREDVYEREGGTTTLLSKPNGVPDPDSGDVEYVGASPGGDNVFFETQEKLSAFDIDSDRRDLYAAQPPPSNPGGGGNPTTPPPSGGGPVALAAANLRGTKRTITVGRNRRFTLGFGAGPGLTGSAAFPSLKRVVVSKRRKVTLARRSFKVPASGKVRLKIRLSRKNFRILTRNRKIRVRLTVTLKDAAGRTSRARKTVTLKAPKRRRR